MKTDYKFWYIERLDDVHISEVAVRFSEGEITTLDEMDGDKLVPVTRYRRSKRLQKEDMPHFDGIETKKELSGNDCFIFTDADFGVITTNSSLVEFLNKELEKDDSRNPIEEQEVKK